MVEREVELMTQRACFLQRKTSGRQIQRELHSPVMAFNIPSCTLPRSLRRSSHSTKLDHRSILTPHFSLEILSRAVSPPQMMDSAERAAEGAQSVDNS